jgi:hypothetical protein
MTRAGNVFGLPGAIFGYSEYDGDFRYFATSEATRRTRFLGRVCLTRDRISVQHQLVHITVPWVQSVRS